MVRFLVFFVRNFVVFVIRRFFFFKNFSILSLLLVLVLFDFCLVVFFMIRFILFLIVVVFFVWRGVKFVVNIKGFLKWGICFIILLFLVCFEGMFKGVWISFFNFGIMVIELFVVGVLEYLWRVLFLDIVLVVWEFVKILLIECILIVFFCLV